MPLDIERTTNGTLRLRPGATGNVIKFAMEMSPEKRAFIGHQVVPPVDAEVISGSMDNSYDPNRIYPGNNGEVQL